MKPDRKRPTRKIVLIGIFLPLWLTTMALLLVILLRPEPDDDYAIARSGQSYRGSIYTRYQGGIYAEVPSNGYYPVAADPGSFVAFSGSWNDRQVGKDRSHVWCGNLLLPGLDPAQTHPLGNGYFSDGKQSYYCSPGSAANDRLSALRFVWQQIRYTWGYGPKPQSYLYPFFPLPVTGRPWHALLDGDFASDGVLVYYRGQMLSQANPATLRRITSVYDDQERASDSYFADGRHVWYGATLLPLSDTPDLRELKIGDISGRTPYLVDRRDGMIYAGALPFDRTDAPYRLLTQGGEHVYHMLFAGKDSIFYYDSEEQKVKRIADAGDSIFLSGGFTALSPYVFQHGNELRYLAGSERWGSSRNPGLIARSTRLYRLDAPPTGTWRKLGDVHGGVFGAVWQNGATLWYFDRLGDGQLVSSPIWRIADQATAQALLDPELRTDTVRQRIRQHKLTIPAHTTLLEAQTRYRGSIWWDYGRMAVPFVLGLLGIRAKRWDKKRKLRQ